MAQLLSFLDLLNRKNLNGRFFKNMELIIGVTLRKIANKSMDKATDEEVKLILKDEFHLTWTGVNAAQGIVILPCQVMFS